VPVGAVFTVLIKADVRRAVLSIIQLCSGPTITRFQAAHIPTSHLCALLHMFQMNSSTCKIFVLQEQPLVP
jgi:hypothetical protein